MIYVQLAVAAFLGLTVYACLGGQIALRGGKVRADMLGMPDLFTGSALVCWFGTVVLRDFGKEAPHGIHLGDVVESASLELALVTAILGFLAYRKIKLPELLGLRKVAAWKVAWMAVLLLAAAYPLIIAAAIATQRVGGGMEEPQEIVQFFLSASERGDRLSLVAVVIMGAVVAPVSEELIFRGYLHALVKRYGGLPAGLLVNSALFAAIHLNQASLAPLFTLAVCFTLVYEATGSILVSMTMHSLFNLATFLQLVEVSRAATS